MLAVVGGKGGCGKTTTALGLGRAAARLGRRPLVVGADPDMPDLRRRAGVDPEPSLSAVPDRGLDGLVQRPAATPGLAVLPAGDRGGVDPGLAAVRAWPGPVVVDCPPGCGEQTAVPLRACDWSVLVTTDRRQSTEDAAKSERVAARLDAPVAARVVRRTPDGRQSPGGVAVPTAEDPLADPRVRERHEGLAARLFDA